MPLAGCVAAALVASWASPNSGLVLSQGGGLEIAVAQKPGETEDVEFAFTGDMEGVTVLHRHAWFSCCLDFAPEVTLEGTTLRLRELDQGPPCLCPLVPWDLEIRIAGLVPADYEVHISGPMEELLATARVTVPETRTAVFVRGAINGDEAVDVADAVSVLLVLFVEAKGPACADAADANDDGAVDVSDAIHLLDYLFGGGPQPPPPFPEPGEDPTADENVCLLRNTVSARDFFRNGDATADGRLDISDCVRLLSGLFLGAAEIPCADAVDFNDDGQLDMGDITALCFPWGPLGPMSPAELGSLECGPDKTPDRLGCTWSPCPR